MTATGVSWGRYPRARQQIIPLHWRDAELPAAAGTLLAHGNGRSYGDSCLNDGGTLLHTRGLDRFMAFDPATGMLRCEAGMLFSDLLDFALPRGWFLPVVPGTRYITVGGAIANDVHGKNHHRAGTFGEHVCCFELLRSDGSRVVCSREVNADLFAATVGGLGLTGLITWAEFALKMVPGANMATQTLRFGNLAEFFALSAQSEQDHEYTVAWIDCSGSGKTFGRGLFIRANHSPAGRPVARPRRLRMPFTPPVSLINRASLRAFNAAYFHASRQGYALTHYQPYFFPLDAIEGWNRIYGPRGFLQYQCVVAPAHAESAVAELLHRIAASGTGSFLAVLKVFSDRPAAGILSFPRAGTTLALDFPNRGAATLALLEQLDDVVVAAGGAVYPAKDARLRGARFRSYFPLWERMLPHIDRRFSSGFWRRVMET
ncbi:MAG TPA: FAD-binding oxidoreductase [Rudaea sp.]|nr:FAD-binding oxidoreductase [Rudaea sp.]